MYNEVKRALTAWNNRTTDRQKLQHIYILLTGVIVLVAGVVTLVNARVGHFIIYFAGATLVTFITNAFIWNLLNSALLSKLPSRTKRK